MLWDGGAVFGGAGAQRLLMRATRLGCFEREEFSKNEQLCFGCLDIPESRQQ